MEGLGRQAHLDLQAARRPEVVGRQAAHLRGHRLEREHLPRGGVAQPLGGDREPDRQRAGPADGRDQDLRAGSEAPDDGRVHPPQAHLGQAEP